MTRRATLALASLLLGAASGVNACELDGLSHGYGPMSALFAGAHRYQSLNGMDKEPVGVIEPAPPPKAGPPSPRRSFVAWAKARPEPAGARAEAPAAWASAPATAAPGASADDPPNAGAPAPDR